MIRDVWASNLEQEIKIISDLIVDYPYIAMDTEFPGVVAKPAGSFKTTEELEYQRMRCNIDILKIIQIGISLGDANGNVPKPCCGWQFNFKFDLSSDPHYQRAITLLQHSGINFEKFNKDGIDVYDFARLIIPSGMVLCDNVTWLTFHGNSDFGYFLKVLTCQQLPDNLQEFFRLLQIYFPHFYDIKYYTSGLQGIANGLQGIADQLHVERIGKEHQAGSDAFVTLKVFFELQRQNYITDINEMSAENKLYGVSPPENNY